MLTIALIMLCLSSQNRVEASIEGNSVKEIFSTIYKTGEWGVNEDGVGYSGGGSLPEIAQPYMEYLQQFLVERNIESVVDLGCGDWTFSQYIDWGKVSYTGIDVVPSVIQKNKNRFEKDNIKFICADGREVRLPSADLFICKEVLQHLSIKSIKAIVAQLHKFKYCLIVNDVDPLGITHKNIDIPDGACRYLDLTRPPFNLKARTVLTYPGLLLDLELKRVILIENR